jgi:hypothetical protein
MGNGKLPCTLPLKPTNKVERMGKIWNHLPSKRCCRDSILSQYAITSASNQAFIAPLASPLARNLHLDLELASAWLTFLFDAGAESYAYCYVLP